MAPFPLRAEQGLCSLWPCAPDATLVASLAPGSRCVETPSPGRLRQWRFGFCLHETLCFLLEAWEAGWRPFGP